MRAEELRTICLHDELEASLNLLKSGFGHLQEIDIGNTFYHLPHQLMASGFERSHYNSRLATIQTPKGNCATPRVSTASSGT